MLLWKCSFAVLQKTLGGQYQKWWKWNDQKTVFKATGWVRRKGKVENERISWVIRIKTASPSKKCSSPGTMWENKTAEQNTWWTYSSIFTLSSSSQSIQRSHELHKWSHTKTEQKLWIPQRIVEKQIDLNRIVEKEVWKASFQFS